MDTMDNTNNLSANCERITREAPQLVTLLKEMKSGLDDLRSKVQALTAKVKADHYPTTDGISYLETKHLLLLNYCQSLVYYLLRKAKGISLEGHPVVRSLVEIRLFLEKIRPIDKKLQYQIQKLTKVTGRTMETIGAIEKDEGATEDGADDLLKYRPNPDMLSTKTNMSKDGVYQPPKFSRISMEEDKVSKKERNAFRKDKEALRQARQNPYVRDLMNDLEGRPEEVMEDVGHDSRDYIKYKEKMEDRARREEELFTRAPLTKEEKKKMKHMKKSRNGSFGVTESFFDEIKNLPLGDGVDRQKAPFSDEGSQERIFKKHKRRH